MFYLKITDSSFIITATVDTISNVKDKTKQIFFLVGLKLACSVCVCSFKEGAYCGVDGIFIFPQWGPLCCYAV